MKPTASTAVFRQVGGLKQRRNAYIYYNTMPYEPLENQNIRNKDQTKDRQHTETHVQQEEIENKTKHHSTIVGGEQLRKQGAKKTQLLKFYSIQNMFDIFNTRAKPQDFITVF